MRHGTGSKNLSAVSRRLRGVAASRTVPGFSVGFAAPLRAWLPGLSSIRKAQWRGDEASPCAEGEQAPAVTVRSMTF